MAASPFLLLTTLLSVACKKLSAMVSDQPATCYALLINGELTPGNSLISILIRLQTHRVPVLRF